MIGVHAPGVAKPAERSVAAVAPALKVKPLYGEALALVFTIKLISVITHAFNPLAKRSEARYRYCIFLSVCVPCTGLDPPRFAFDVPLFTILIKPALAATSLSTISISKFCNVVPGVATEPPAVIV